jgi:hypothetical protein
MRQMTGESGMGKSVSTTAGVEDIDFGPDVTQEQIDAAINSGDPDVINALLAGKMPENINVPDEEPEFQDIKDEEVKEKSTSESNSTEAEKVTEKQDEKGATSGAVDDSPAAEVKAESEERAPISGKSGQSTIPYAVLESTRAERNQLRAKVQELESKNQKVNQFLQSKGIDLSELTEAQAESLTPEEIAQLAELDPVLGKAMRVLASAIERAPQQSAPVTNPLMDAINRNTDLSKWINSDPDRWEFAESVDSKLMNDPNFKSLSLDERFAEAVRRTKIAFGDVTEPVVPPKEETTRVTEKAEQIAAKKVAEATQAAVPRSLTNIGVTPSAERPLAERLAEMSPDEISVAMQTMTQDQIDQVLSAIS